MSRVVIIGGTGHLGTYLVPRLVCAGFEVINVSRGERALRRMALEMCDGDSREAEEGGAFGGRSAS